MKNKNTFSIFTSFIVLIISIGIFQIELSGYSQNSNKKPGGSYYSGKYKNLFSELLNKTDSEINAKLNSAFNQLFYGDNETERVYYPVGNDMAYIEDILHDDVRTEGMSYGMMIAVQFDKKNEFDNLWKWAKTYMQHEEGEHRNFFAWHCKTDGSIIDSNSASDGEEWIVMSLFFASARWGNGEGIYNYETEAKNILDAMLNKTDSSDNKNVVTNMFNKKEKQVVFVPTGNADDFTDPSYHLPHYYELWGRWADKNNQFWCDAASFSRVFLKKAANPETGLTPDYANFDGSPADPWKSGSHNFRYDAWRTIMNIAIDYSWFAKDEWQIKECNTLLNFFYDKGIGEYGSLYTLEGKKLLNDHSTGLVAMNASAALVSTNDNRKDFVEELWNVKIPSGEERYYDGLLYMLALQQVSGNFKIYNLQDSTVSNCRDQ